MAEIILPKHGHENKSVQTIFSDDNDSIEHLKEQLEIYKIDYIELKLAKDSLEKRCIELEQQNLKLNMKFQIYGNTKKIVEKYKNNETKVNEDNILAIENNFEFMNTNNLSKKANYKEDSHSKITTKKLSEQPKSDPDIIVYDPSNLKCPTRKSPGRRKEVTSDLNLTNSLPVTTMPFECSSKRALPHSWHHSSIANSSKDDKCVIDELHNKTHELNVEKRLAEFSYDTGALETNDKLLSFSSNMNILKCPICRKTYSIESYSTFIVHIDECCG